MKQNTITIQLNFSFNGDSEIERKTANELYTMADSAVFECGPMQITRETVCAKRKTLNRYVLIAAHARGVSPSAMWIILYHHIAKTLGQHPTVISYQKKLETHLDALMEIDKGYDTAMAYLLEQITKYSADVV